MKYIIRLFKNDLSTAMSSFLCVLLAVVLMLRTVVTFCVPSDLISKVLAWWSVGNKVYYLFLGIAFLAAVILLCRCIIIECLITNPRAQNLDEFFMEPDGDDICVSFRKYEWRINKHQFVDDAKCLMPCDRNGRHVSHVRAKQVCNAIYEKYGRRNIIAADNVRWFELEGRRNATKEELEHIGMIVQHYLKDVVKVRTGKAVVIAICGVLMLFAAVNAIVTPYSLQMNVIGYGVCGILVLFAVVVLGYAYMMYTYTGAEWEQELLEGHLWVVDVEIIGNYKNYEDSFSNSQHTVAVRDTCGNVCSEGIRFSNLEENSFANKALLVGFERDYMGGHLQVMPYPKVK